MYEELTPLQAIEELKQNDIDDTRMFNYLLYDIIEKALKDDKKKLEFFECMFTEFTYYIERDPFTLGELAKIIQAFKIIKKHKLLNYVIKNKKCASMYKLTDEEIEILRKGAKGENA